MYSQVVIIGSSFLLWQTWDEQPPFVQSLLSLHGPFVDVPQNPESVFGALIGGVGGIFVSVSSGELFCVQPDIRMIAMMRIIMCFFMWYY